MTDSTILYVARDKRKPDVPDLGSILCMHVVDEYKLAVKVMECSSLRRPNGVVGTPTLVLEGVVHTGHAALYALQRLAVASAPGAGTGSSPRRARRPRSIRNEPSSAMTDDNRHDPVIQLRDADVSDDDADDKKLSSETFERLAGDDEKSRHANDRIIA
jgi:hypothetical protein